MSNTIPSAQSLVKLCLSLNFTNTFLIDFDTTACFLELVYGTPSFDFSSITVVFYVLGFENFL